MAIETVPSAQFAQFDADEPHSLARTMSELDMRSDLVIAGYRYWESCRKGRPMPMRADLDPLIDIPALVPSVMLFDVRKAPLDFRWRLVGTKVRQNFWKDYTGQWFSGDGNYGNQQSSVWQSMKLVAETGKPVLHRPVYVGPHDDFLSVENVLRPLSLDGETCGMQIIFIDFIRKKLR